MFWSFGKKKRKKDMNSSSIVTAANTDFGFRLLRRLVEDKTEGNVFFSPLSVSSALTMTLNGTDGQTAQDMAQTLGLTGLPLEQVNDANGRLLPLLTAPDPKITVSSANALWARQGVTLALAFQDRCRRFYAASAEALDFASPEAATTINDWISRNTRGKITNLVSHADVAAALVVLTNALYLHGLWQVPFDSAETRPAPFNVSGSAAKTVSFMLRYDTSLYAETVLGQWVSLPYGDGRMSLFVLLPELGQTVEDVARRLDAETWAAQIAALKPARLTLWLPRFRAEYAVRLQEPLAALGMASAFQRSAAMGLGDAFIGDVIHKAALNVDEEGTVAAAATAVVMVLGASTRPALMMRVDRPFFLAVRDNATGMVLFEGVIRDPQQPAE